MTSQEEIVKAKASSQQLDQHLKEEYLMNTERKGFHTANQKEVKAKLKQIGDRIAALKKELIVAEAELDQALIEVKKSEKLLNSRKAEVEQIIAVGSLSMGTLKG